MPASFTYTKLFERAFQGAIDFDADTLRAMLVRPGYNARRSHDFVSSGPAASENSGGNYARVTLTGASVAVDDTANELELDAADNTFSSPDTAQQVQAVIIYKQVGGDDTTPGDDPLGMYVARAGADVVGVDTANDEITIAGDQTADFASGDDIKLNDHPTHEGVHTLNAAPSLSGGDTILPVGTDLTDGTVQGFVAKLLNLDGNNIDVSFATEAIAKVTT